MPVNHQFDEDRIYDLKALKDEFCLERWAATRLVDRGALQQVATGCYVAGDFVPGIRDEIAVVALRCPHAVVHLHSAADFHGLANRSTPDVFFAIPVSRRAPTIGGNFGAGLRATRVARSEDFSVGVERIRIRGVEVALTSKERTVCDMWRYSASNPSLKGDGPRVGMEELEDVTSAYFGSRPDAADRLARTMEELAPGKKALQAFVDHLRTFGSGYRSGRAA